MNDIKKILVPIDYSKPSLKALNYALELAESIHAEVIIHHAIFPFMITEDYFEYSIVENSINAKKEKLQKFIKNLSKKKNSNDIKISYSCHIGLPCQSILEVTKNQKIDLIILGTGGTKDFNQVIIGSKTANIISNSTVPVFLLPINSIVETNKTEIVFATDFLDVPKGKSKKILIAFAKSKQAQINVLHIIKSGNMPEIEILEKEFNKGLNQIPHKFSYVSNSNPIVAINEYLNNSSSQILCLIKRKHGIISGLFHKSVSKYLALHGNFPLLVLPE
jgi:nucleotide-binding universal stress UspA family protein